MHHASFIPPRHRLTVGTFLAAVLLASVMGAAAQLPQPKLFTVFPPGAKAGTTVDVALTGADLDDIQLHFTHPGITAKALAKPNQFAISVAANVPTGSYEARAFGRFGLSNPRTFMVGTLPEVNEKSDNKSLESAQEIKLDSVIMGVPPARRRTSSSSR